MPNFWIVARIGFWVNGVWVLGRQEEGVGSGFYKPGITVTYVKYGGLRASSLVVDIKAGEGQKGWCKHQTLNILYMKL